MKRLAWMLLALALLPGCAAQRLETVDDTLPDGTLAGADCVMQYQLPDGAVALEPEQRACRVYEQLQGDYAITAQTVMADDLSSVIYAVSGFDQPQLQVLAREVDGRQCYEFAWCSAGETGEQVCQAMVYRDGDYYYALSAGVREDAAAEYRDSMQAMFDSFTLADAPE